MTPLRHPPRRAGARGFTIIELMLAMLLGLIVTGSVLGVVLMMLQTARVNSALGQVQSGARLAFELMAHDIRNARLTGCGNPDERVTNMLKQQATAWWADWKVNAFIGHTGSQLDPAAPFGTAQANRAAGTDSITLLGAADTAMSVSAHDPVAGTFTVSGAIGNLQAGGGDVLIVCDPEHAAIFQTASASATSLSYGADTLDAFNANAQIAPLSAVNWYVGISGANDGTWSLYRQTLGNDAGTPTPAPQEMVRNVTRMDLRYLQAGQFLLANDATIDWTKVTAVQVTLELKSDSRRAGANAQPLVRSYTTTVALYNRLD